MAKRKSPYRNKTAIDDDALLKLTYLARIMDQPPEAVLSWATKELYAAYMTGLWSPHQIPGGAPSLAQIKHEREMQKIGEQRDKSANCGLVNVALRRKWSLWKQVHKKRSR